MTDGWLLAVCFLLGLLVLLAAEAIRPMHLQPVEAKGRLVANFGLGSMNAGLLLLLPLSTVGAAGWSALSDFGLMHWLELSAGPVFAMTLVVRSLSAYLLHRLSHSAPALWRLHRIHHADTAVDLSTGFRHHPLDLLLALVLQAGLAALLGLSAAALALYEGFAVALTAWSHGNFRLSPRLDSMLCLLIVTPAMHHVHHGARRQETDSNFGELLSCWDRLFGTYHRHRLEDVRAMRLGLGDLEDDGASSLLRQLVSPVRPGSARAVPTQDSLERLET